MPTWLLWTLVVVFALAGGGVVGYLFGYARGAFRAQVEWEHGAYEHPDDNWWGA